MTQTDANGHTTTWTYDYFGRVTSRTLPEGQSESTVYDDANRTMTHTDFNGDTMFSQMDSMGRVSSMTYSKDGRVETYTYYPNGQTHTVTTPEGVTEYFYDNRNRLEKETRPSGEIMEYGYDDVSNRTLVKVTRNSTVTSQTSYTYDGLNRLKTVTNDLSPSDVTVYGYDPVGNMDTVTYANGMVTDYDYNTINQLTDVYTRDGDGNLVSHYNYGLKPTGRRETITEPLTGRTTTYGYDNLYRLETEDIVDATNGDYSAVYEYDFTGNRTYETVDGVQTAYTYDDNDRLLQTGGTVYGYDENGNTLTETLDGNVKTYTWDGRNKLTNLDNAGTVTSYEYNHNGIRTSKTEGGSTTLFIIDENRNHEQVLEEVVNDSIQVQYVYGHDLISQSRNGTNLSYYHYDGQGSTRSLSDISGSFVKGYNYNAFGRSLNETGTLENTYRYHGEQYDPSLDQYYLRARLYNQEIGRFTSMDTWAGKSQDPITLHKYTFGNADPVNNTDPTGNFSLGSLSVGQTISATLTTASIASSAFNFFQIASGQKELSAKNVG